MSGLGAKTLFSLRSSSHYKKYTGVLFPALIAIEYQHSLNFSILSQDMSVGMLTNFVVHQRARCTLKANKTKSIKTTTRE